MDNIGSQRVFNFYGILLDFFNDSVCLIIAAVFAVLRDKWRVSIGLIVFQVDDACGNHFHQRETFTETGDPAVGFVVAGLSHEQAVFSAAVAFQGEIDLLFLAALIVHLAEYVGGKVLLHKFLERGSSVFFLGYLIDDFVAAFQAGFDDAEHFD